MRTSQIFISMNLKITQLVFDLHDDVKRFVANIIRDGIIVPERDAVNENGYPDDGNWD